MASLALKLPDLSQPAAPLPVELLRDGAIDRILSSVRGHLGVEIAFVARYVEDGLHELTHVSTDLDLPMGPGFRQPRENVYCWHILNGNLPELIQDPADHPWAQQLAITHQLPVGCHINTPLRLTDGTVWGSFCALSRQPDRSMNPRDLAILKSFASLAGERIESALEDEVRHDQARRRVQAMLDGHSVSVFQQPIHSLLDDRPVGVECLARFPDVNRRGPAAWFEDAELVGLGKELEMTAVACALETVSAVPDGIYAAINASPRTILSGDLHRALADHEIAHGPANLVIEVTEYEEVEDYAALVAAIDGLRPFARIAIDDVGTGYAGLRHLIDLKPDLLKLDMLITRDIDKDPARRAITAAMVQFAREIGCRLLAEGVETQAELAMLRSLGVDYGQGYLFARPLPVVAAQQHLLGIRM